MTVTTWNPGEGAAYRLFSDWTRSEALAIAEWDRSSMAGTAADQRPIPTPALELQERARATA